MHTLTRKIDAVEVEQRLVFCEVYAPDRPDSDMEFMVAEDIKKMAYDFIKKGRVEMIDTNHDNELVTGACIVESFIARKGDPDFIEGSWVVGIHVDNDETWAAIKKGEINGLSVQAMVYGSEEEVELEIPPVISGQTSVAKSESGIDHEHQYFVTYDEQGRFMGGKTNMIEGHSHVIKRGTFTEKAEGHTHRFVSVDNVKIHHE